MIPLFSVEGRKRLAQIAQPGLLCAFDFDGTLAPIVIDPEKAQTPQNVVTRLDMLASFVNLAVITGRSINNVKDKLGFTPAFLVGNHGLEGIPGNEHQLNRYRETCIAWNKVLTTQLEDYTVFDPNIWVENKEFSLSVHYRLARDRQKTEATLCNLFAISLPDARIIAGKCVFNLLPKNAGDKGTALEQLIDSSQASSVIYVGDDITDEYVFGLRHPAIMSIKIGHDPSSKAEFFLAHRLNLLQLLDEINSNFKFIHLNNE